MTSLPQAMSFSINWLTLGGVIVGIGSSSCAAWYQAPSPEVRQDSGLAVHPGFLMVVSLAG